MTIRLYVGTDPQQAIAERALEASVRANTSQPVDITWMRYGDPGWDWGGLDAGWATPFSMFRWYVPETCGYKGRAIYMDCDQLALGDLTELWEWEIPLGHCGMYAGRSSFKADVILWQCHFVPKWKREDFLSMAAFFSQMTSKGRRPPPTEAIRYIEYDKEFRHPETKQVVRPRFLDGTEPLIRPLEDRREVLAKWITSMENPWFARATVNRFWNQFMGRPLVDPVRLFWCPTWRPTWYPK